MRAPILLLSLAALVAGCAGADDPTRTTSSLTCGGASCTLTLAEAGGFTIELTSSECVAVETEVRLTTSTGVAETLMDDACRVEAGEEWEFGLTPATQFPAGTDIDMQITADQFASAPSLVVTGDQTWEVRYEDGFDTDQDDLIFVVTAVPAS
jgi:hypothetical protein